MISPMTMTIRSSRLRPTPRGFFFVILSENFNSQNVNNRKMCSRMMQKSFLTLECSSELAR
jgi:hypothetical protein